MEILIDGKSIFKCNKDELQEVQMQLKHAWHLSDQRAAVEFSPGQKVKFKHRGGVVNAEVVKINKTSVSVSSEIGRYNVSPTLLTSAE